ncbi:MAG: hypothetical protein JSU06_03920 [Actinobacteria bacterium]|nr:hypothetical protein [Actinomycetota bacterium]
MAQRRPQEWVSAEAPTPRARFARTILAVAIVVGAQALWLLIPAATLWTVGQIVDTTEAAFFIAMLAIPAAVVAFAWVLGAANRRWLRMAGRGGQGPLEAVISPTIVLALIALSVWLAFFAAHAPSGREQLIP